MKLPNYKLTKRLMLLEEDFKFVYWDNENFEAKTLLVYFPSGFENGSDLKRISGILNPKYRLLAPCYPGRAGTTPLKTFDDFTQIALVLKEWLGNLKIKQRKIIFWGISFGTAVVTELLLLAPEMATKIVLFTPGEFFSENPLKNLVRKIFIQAHEDRKLLLGLRSLLHKFYPFNNSRFFKSDALSLDEQWLATLDFKIAGNSRINAPTLIILCNPDLIITEESREKVFKLYTNHEVITLEHQHILDMYREQKLFYYLLEKHLTPFIEA